MDDVFVTVITYLFLSAELSRDSLSFSDVSITKIPFLKSDLLVKDFLLLYFFWVYSFHFSKRTGHTRAVLGGPCRKISVLSPWRFAESEEGSCWLLCPLLLGARVRENPTAGGREGSLCALCRSHPAVSPRMLPCPSMPGSRAEGC